MGMYRKEWSCCGSVTETDAWEPEACPFCTPPREAYVLELLVAAGHVTQAKVDEAFVIARGVKEAGRG